MSIVSEVKRNSRIVLIELIRSTETMPTRLDVANELRRRERLARVNPANAEFYPKYKIKKAYEPPAHVQTC